MSNAVEEANLASEERLMRERDEARAEVEQLRQQVRVLTGLHRSAEEEVERLSALLNPDDEALVSAILNRLNWHKTDALKHDIRTILGALRREAALGGERDE